MKRLLKLLGIALVAFLVIIPSIFWHYDQGDRISRDFEWVKAFFGLPNAQYRLGFMYRYGIDGPVDREAAVALLTKAAYQRHIQAQSLLATMHFNGLGTPKDRVQGCAWMMLAHYQAVVPENRNFCEEGLRVLQHVMRKDEVEQAKILCIALHKRIFPYQPERVAEINQGEK